VLGSSMPIVLDSLVPPPPRPLRACTSYHAFCHINPACYHGTGDRRLIFSRSGCPHHVDRPHRCSKRGRSGWGRC
jgi:hypothetical protein